MTAKDLITSAMKKIGALGPGEAAESHEVEDGLAALNRMLNLWSAKRLMVYATTQISHTMTIATASYTIGSGATVNTTRPMRILSGFIRDSNSVDTPLKIRPLDDYNTFTDKTLQGRPEVIAYRPSFPLGTFYLYPAPQEAYTIYLEGQIPLGELASASTEFTFPGEYEEAVIYNLAVRLAADYGRTITAEIAAIAADAYKTVRELNAPPVPDADTDIPRSTSRGSYMDIYRGY